MKGSRQILFFFSVVVLTIAFSSFDQGGKGKFSGYKKMDGGSYFRLMHRGNGTLTTDTGGAIFVKIKFLRFDDSAFIDVNKEANQASYPMRLDKSSYKGDFLEMFSYLHIGDSAVFFVSLDSSKKYFPNEFSFEPKYDTMKYLGFAVKVDSIYSKEKVVKLRDAAEIEKKKQDDENARIAKVMMPIQDKAKAKEAELKEKDFKLLAKYIKTWDGPKNPEPDGIFYHEIKPGTGDTLRSGMTVAVRYTGKYLDGTIFDSNTLVENQAPMFFKLGVDPMIPGFTLGLSKMKLGTKAIFIVPSQLGYSDGLTRVFEVEVVSAKP